MTLGKPQVNVLRWWINATQHTIWSSCRTLINKSFLYRNSQRLAKTNVKQLQKFKN